MAAHVELAVPWLPDEPVHIDDVVIRRGGTSLVRFEDGITLAVRLIDPGDAASAEELVAGGREAAGPGTLTMVAGPLPARWRAELREAGQSWFDPSGVLMINWPRLQVDSHRASLSPASRRRGPLPLQKGHGVVAQEIVVKALARGTDPSLRSLAVAAEVQLSTASRAVSTLEAHGFVVKERHGREVTVSVPDVRALAELLSMRTGWRTAARLWGYGWGQSCAHAAGRAAHRLAYKAAVTGRVAALFHGVAATDEPEIGRLRVRVAGDQLLAAATEMGVEPVDRKEANLELAADPWGLGAHRSDGVTLGDTTFRLAHPVRIWCDLRDEPRGEAFAEHLRRGIERRRRTDDR